MINYFMFLWWWLFDVSLYVRKFKDGLGVRVIMFIFFLVKKEVYEKFIKK